MSASGTVIFHEGTALVVSVAAHDEKRTHLIIASEDGTGQVSIVGPETELLRLLDDARDQVLAAKFNHFTAGVIVR
jgi:hypothetical protein